MEYNQNSPALRRLAGVDRRKRKAEFVRSVNPNAPMLSVDWLIREFGRLVRIVGPDGDLR